MKMREGEAAKAKAGMEALRKRAKELKAEITFDKSCGYRDVMVDAPKGYKFVTAGLHCIVDNCADEWSNDFDDILNRMSGGVEPCEDPECDICNEA